VSYSELLLRDSAEILWPLDDLDISSAYSESINFYSRTASAYSAVVDFNNCAIQGVPMINGGGKCLELKSSSVCLSIPALGRFSNLYKDKNSFMSFWLKVDSLSMDERPILKKRGEDFCGLFIKENYLIFKFGTEQDHSVIIGELVNPDEPHLITISVTPSYRSMAIDSEVSRIFISSDSFPEFDGHPSNDFIDFYGPSEGSWSIDCPAFFQDILDDAIVKRHYVYGLGKWMPYDLFYSRGGTIYNFTNISTERNYSISWDFPQEWRLSKFEDLYFGPKTVESIKFESPELFSFDNKIDKTGNQIKFQSSSNTLLTYIDIKSIQSKIGNNSPLFLKFKVPEEPMVEDIFQRLMTFGRSSELEILSIDILSDGEAIKFNCTSVENNFTTTLTSNNLSPGDEFYIGFQFNNKSIFYLLEDNNPIQTASFNFIDSEGYGQDPLLPLYPFPNDSVLRIGATLTYDLKSSPPLDPFEFNQFRGCFVKLLSIKPQDIENIDGISYLDNYKKMRYGISYLTDEDRFKVSTYGFGQFFLHSIDLGEYISDFDQRLDANIIDIGYPDIASSSALQFFVTQEDYSGSVVVPPTRLKEKNFLPFLNNKNISGTRLRFNFEIYSDDRIYYPPRIQYFRMESYGEGDGRLTLRDSGAPPFFVYPNSSSVIYLPETTLTPTVFLKNNSGMKIDESRVEFIPDISEVSLNPTDIPDMILWLDSRFPDGFRKNDPEDDSRLTFWTDLSGNDFHAEAPEYSSAPIYRSQSLNLFTLNQLTGSELNFLNNINPFNSTLDSSLQSITGTKSIAVTPNGSSTDSYIEFSNTASISVFPNQEYTVVGSIKLNKRQTASALNELARRIVVLNDDGSGPEIVATSASINNLSGVYSASLRFSTSSATISSSIRFYNGSLSIDDTVYWDDLGLYPISSSVVYSSGGTASVQNIIAQWIPPLSSNDSPTIKFDGNSTYMISSASTSTEYTLYLVARAFDKGTAISSTDFNLRFEGDFINLSGSTSTYSPVGNSFNIIAIVSSEDQSRAFINGVGSDYLPSGKLEFLSLGSDSLNNYLNGDICAVLLYAGKHDPITRSAIENWLDESFNLTKQVLGITALNNQYTDEYTREYLNL
jgi:hypothetical protein